MADKDRFDRYLLALRKTPVGEKTEHTDRLALQTLLQAFADDAGSGVSVQHEPKRVVDKGAPDFKITTIWARNWYVRNGSTRRGNFRAFSNLPRSDFPRSEADGIRRRVCANVGLRPVSSAA